MSAPTKPWVMSANSRRKFSFRYGSPIFFFSSSNRRV